MSIQSNIISVFGSEADSQWCWASGVDEEKTSIMGLPLPENRKSV